MKWIIFGVLILFLVLFVAFHVRIVEQSKSVVIERLGSYYETWGTGVHFLVPFIDRVAQQISLKEHVVDFDPQPVITKDNVTMQIDTVVYFQVTDSKLYTYGVNNPMMAVENLTASCYHRLC